MRKLLILSLLVAAPVVAAPVGVAPVEGGSAVIFHDDACKLKVQLPYRVVWQERGKATEGCYGVHPFGIIVAYFEDGSIALIPPQLVKPADEV